MLIFLLVLNLCLGADKLIIFFARNTLHLPPAQIGLIVTAGGVGGLLGAVGTSALCRRSGPCPSSRSARRPSGVALILIGAATALPRAAGRATCSTPGRSSRPASRCARSGRRWCPGRCWAG